MIKNSTTNPINSPIMKPNKTSTIRIAAHTKLKTSPKIENKAPCTKYFPSNFN
jgi:hypothetical protein